MTMDIIQTLLVGCSGPKKGRFVCEVQQNACLLGFLGLLGQEYSLDIGQYTSLGNGDT